MALKKTSALMNIGGEVIESDVNTFTEQEVNLPLSTIDREVFVVTDVVSYITPPDLNAGSLSAVTGYVSKSSLAARGRNGVDPSESYFIASKQIFIYDDGAGTAVLSENMPNDQLSSGTTRDHLGIIATPQFYLSIRGSECTTAKQYSVRLTGYRAKADADTYAALVTEELSD